MGLLDNVDWDQLDMESVLANSYRDFHCKGLDYICLKRSREWTLKAYFFEDPPPEDSYEVVSPHDHRYGFYTQVMSGQIMNTTYAHRPHRPEGQRQHFWRFSWDTPLNGGDGFLGEGLPITLWTDRRGRYDNRCGAYAMMYHQIHTLQVLEPQTCIVLAQLKSESPRYVTTSTYCPTDTPPKIDDLYNTFTADQAMKRIKLLRELLERNHG